MDCFTLYSEEIYVDNPLNMKISIWLLCKCYHKTLFIIRDFKSVKLLNSKNQQLFTRIIEFF